MSDAEPNPPVAVKKNKFDDLREKIAYHLEKSITYEEWATELNDILQSGRDRNEWDQKVVDDRLYYASIASYHAYLANYYRSELEKEEWWASR